MSVTVCALSVSWEEVVVPRQPYDFYWTSSLYSFGWEFDGKRAYFGTIIDGECVIAVLERYGKGNRIRIRGYGSDSDEFVRRVHFVFGFEENLSEFFRIIRNDPLLGILAERFYGVHMRAMDSLWSAGLIGICQQNTGFRQGWKMIARLRKMFGRKIILDGREYFLFPEPSQVIRAGKELLKAGVGYRYETILRFAKAVEEGHRDPLSVKGIGQYTRNLAIILAERDYSVFPVDKWFRRIIPYFYEGKKETWKPSEILSFAKRKWGRWMGLAAIMITAVTGAEPYPSLVEKGEIDPTPDRPAPFTLWKYI